MRLLVCVALLASCSSDETVKPVPAEVREFNRWAGQEYDSRCSFRASSVSESRAVAEATVHSRPGADGNTWIFDRLVFTKSGDGWTCHAGSDQNKANCMIASFHCGN